MDRGTRASMIDSKSDLSLRLQCRLLQVPRGSHYYKPRAMSPLNAYLMRVIDQQYQRTPFYGVPRMTDFINHACGYKVNKKRIERLYKIMDIRALGPNPFTSRADKTVYKYPYLLANLKDVYPNQVWVADITYLGLKNGFMYLFAIMDYATRYIIAWDISNSMTTEWCVYVLKEALEFYPTPEIMNTDQGSQFTSPKYVKCLEDNGIKISMDGKGRAIDNVFIERFWRSLKYEHIYLNPANGGKELYDGVHEYMNFYNFERLHSTLDKSTPAEAYFGTKPYFEPTKYSMLLV